MIQSNKQKKISNFWCCSVLVENHMLNARFYFVTKVKILLCAITYYLVKIKVMDETSALSEMWTVKSLWERGLESSIFQQAGIKVVMTVNVAALRASYFSTQFPKFSLPLLASGHKV